VIMPDFRLDNHGSIYLLTPLTPAADDWVNEHLPDDLTTFGPGIAVEHRYIAPIVEGIIDDGLTVK
jgi:hypothetical protein